MSITNRKVFEKNCSVSVTPARRAMETAEEIQQIQSESRAVVGSRWQLFNPDPSLKESCLYRQ